MLLHLAVPRSTARLPVGSCPTLRVLAQAMVERRLWARVDDREDKLGERGFFHSGWRPAFALAEEFALVSPLPPALVARRLGLWGRGLW